MIRADMDALPMEELGDCPYRSQNKGVAHMCGHDAHTAALIGAARILSQLRDEFPGTVKLCFQPAEEAATGGAQAMVAEGVLEDPYVDFSIGMHVTPSRPVGYAAIEPGPITAYPDFFSFIFTAKGGNESFPSTASSNSNSMPMSLALISEKNRVQVCASRPSPQKRLGCM